MVFNYEVIDDTFDKQYMVWERTKMKKESVTPGVLFFCY